MGNGLQSSRQNIDIEEKGIAGFRASKAFKSAGQFFYTSGRGKMSLKPLTIYPLCYVLELEDGFWYIGSTLDLNKRLSQHYAGEAAGWTKQHKPISVESVFYPTNGIDDENEITKTFVVAYGAEKVRGGSWTKIDKPPPQFTKADLSGKYQIIETDEC